MDINIIENSKLKYNSKEYIEELLNKQLIEYIKLKYYKQLSDIMMDLSEKVSNKNVVKIDFENCSVILEINKI